MGKDRWISVYSTIFAHQAEIAVQVLRDKGIIGVMVNKRDSSYTTFGDIEVHVKQDDVIRAKQYLKDLEA